MLKDLKKESSKRFHERDNVISSAKAKIINKYLCNSKFIIRKTACRPSAKDGPKNYSNLI